jgi:hypothetical protein
MQIKSSCRSWVSGTILETGSYYRKESAALQPKPWGVIIPIKFIYHTVCMNLFCLKKIELHVIVGTNALNRLHLSKRLEEHN